MSGYELNVSCPNVKAGGMEFGADPASLTDVVTRARAATKKPLFVKLSPTLQDIGEDRADRGRRGRGRNLGGEHDARSRHRRRATRKPALGFGTGGVSGPALLPVGVLATHKVSKAVKLPVIGVGGISKATDIVQYVIAGASLVAIGTAAMQQPRLPEKLIDDLEEWCQRNGVRSLSELRGTLAWEA